MKIGSDTIISLIKYCKGITTESASVIGLVYIVIETIKNAKLLPQWALGLLIVLPIAAILFIHSTKSGFSTRQPIKSNQLNSNTGQIIKSGDIHPVRTNMPADGKSTIEQTRQSYPNSV